MSDKGLLRGELLKKRDAIPAEVRRAKDRLIRGNLLALEEIGNAKTLFFFASFRSEVDTIEMMRELLGQCKRIVLPKVDTDKHVLVLYEIREMEELSAGYMGIPEPSVTTEDRAVGVGDVDAVIIPGAGFDASGNRIGYGGGYYDRLLATLGKEVPVIAPAYEEQLVESIPSEPHDVRISMIVTDRRVIRCAGGA